MSFISRHPKVCRRLFGRTYNPKTLFYLAYKTARLNCLDISKLPLTIRNQQYEIDQCILWCDEDINHIIGEEHLNDWDFSTIQYLPIHMFLALQNLKEIPEWLDETMWIEFYWILNESYIGEFDHANERMIEQRMCVKQCKKCFKTFTEQASFDPVIIRYTKVTYVQVHDAERILSILQDMYYWCESCKCTPLFKLIKVEYN